MLQRPSCFALLAVIASAGCHSGGLRRTPEPLPSPAVSLEKDKVIETLARNSAPIRSLQTNPSITMTQADGRRVGLGGRLRLERPRNFKFEVQNPAGRTEADIGSNADGFWMSIKSDKKIYTAAYDEDGNAPQGIGLQPDWIVEALGFREYTEADRARIEVRKTTSGTFKLIERAKTADGQDLVKETEVNKLGQASRYTLFSESKGKRSRLASAEILSYKKYTVNDPDSPGQSQDAYLPDRIKLAWFSPEKLEIDVETLGRPELNPSPFPKTAFNQPPYPTYAHVPLDDRRAVAVSNPGETTVRETLSPPPPRASLGTPIPLGVDGSARTSYDPSPPSRDSSPGRRTGAPAVVRPSQPGPGVPDFLRTETTNGGLPSPPAFFER